MASAFDVMKNFIKKVCFFLCQLLKANSSTCVNEGLKIQTNEDIFGGSWEGSEICNKRFGDSFEKSRLLSRNQCENLWKNIHIVSLIIDSLKKLDKEDLLPLVQEFLIILTNCYVLVERCGNTSWCEEAIWHVNDKEIFCDQVGEIKYWCEVANKLLDHYYPNEFKAINCFVITHATQEEINDDINDLIERLSKVIEEKDEQFEALAKHLMQRVKDLKWIEFGEVEMPYLLNPCAEIIEDVAFDKGAFGQVCKGKWLGVQCAIKKVNNTLDEAYKEVNILMKLSHPNVILYYFAKEESISKNMASIERIEESELKIGMELMDYNLESILKKKRSLCNMACIDIMLQIAKGMCYLHDMHVAHRDLKPENILVNILETIIMGKSVQHVIAKVIDFGISKVEVGSNAQVVNEQKLYGSNAYVAPEVLNTKFIDGFEGVEVSAFEADVYSFAIVCAYILCKEDLFFGYCSFKERFENVMKDKRPTLPSTNGGLSILIKECWSSKYQVRPKFLEICERLNKLKKECILATYKESGSSSDQEEENLKYCKKNRLDIKAKEVLLGRKKVLLEIEEKCENEVKTLCLIGMGGIGKTTLAKKILEDINMKDMYDASCFIESGGDDINMSCDILKLFEPSQECQGHKKTGQLDQN